MSISPHERVVNITDRVEFACRASGYPNRHVVWSREEGGLLEFEDGVVEKDIGECVGSAGRERERKGRREGEREGERERMK